MFSSKRLLGLCALVLVLAGAACKSSSGALETESVATPEPSVVHPLTGVAHTGDPDWRGRPVLAVKIGNAAPERPQAGLDKADLTYEEIVEGGATRFMAVFSTNDVSRVGPVRSARKVDPTLLEPLNALFAYSGGAPSTIRVLRSSSGFTDVGVDRASGAYHRDRSRSSPYNLYTSTQALWDGRDGGPPQAQFAFLAEGEDPGSGSDEAAAEIRFSFAGNGADVRYVFTDGRYQRYLGDSAHLGEGGVALTYANVVVQYVQTSAGSSIDKAGFRSTDITTTGSGELIVVRGGKALRGTWSRSSTAEPARFADAQGNPIALAPGPTMIALLPQGRPVTVSGPAA